MKKDIDFEENVKESFLMFGKDISELFQKNEELEKNVNSLEEEIQRLQLMISMINDNVETFVQVSESLLDEHEEIVEDIYLRIKSDTCS